MFCVVCGHKKKVHVDRRWSVIKWAEDIQIIRIYSLSLCILLLCNARFRARYLILPQLGGKAQVTQT